MSHFKQLPHPELCAECFITIIPHGTIGFVEAHKQTRQHLRLPCQNRTPIFLGDMTSKTDYFGNMSMEELDALSSDDDSSDDEEEAPIRNLPPRDAASQRKTTLTDFAGFEEASNDDDPIAKQMQSMLALRLSLRMDDDKEFMEAQEKKKLDRQKLAKMTPEERLRYQEEKAGSLLSNVKNKFDIEAIRKRRMQKDDANIAKTPAPSKVPVVDVATPVAEPKECETTASESDSLSDESGERIAEEDLKKGRKHKEGSKPKKKREDKKTKKKEKGSDHKRSSDGNSKKHSNHQPRRLEDI